MLHEEAAETEEEEKRQGCRKAISSGVVHLINSSAKQLTASLFLGRAVAGTVQRPDGKSREPVLDITS